MIQIGFMSLVGCWKDFSSLPQVDIDEIPFASSDALTADAKIAILESSRECPDGEKSPTFVVYPPSEDPLPVAVIFHSNSAAFISNFDLSQGRIPDRLTASWTENKLWETLGMSQHPQDLYENSQGYLSIALSNAGFLQIYPGNCWGDYWHSDPERYPNAEHIALNTSTEDTSAPTYFG
ncbi:MAG: hypothetical protein VX278_22415 [Myxococcota bacterium]|nr:hypothetical protein [Myxococcota bacterium]